MTSPTLTVPAMGLRRALRLAKAADDGRRATASILTAANVDPAALAAFGINTDTETISRRQAMTIPTVKRGRGVICGVVSSLPLTLLDSSGHPLPNAPAWLGQPNPSTTLAYELTWTVDDLLFGGIAWWRVTTRYANGYPATFERLDPSRVLVVYTANGGGDVYVDGHLADDRDLVRFDGPDEGILRTGGPTLRTAITLRDAVKRLAKLDVPLGYFRPMEGATPLDATKGSANDPDDPDASEVDKLLDSWEAARVERNTAYMNRAIEYVTTQLDATKIQLTEQTQQIAVEIARLLNLSPAYVAAPTGDSMTYSTTEGNRRELVDVSLAPFIQAIDQRLSMGDITPQGQRVRMNRAAWMRGDLLNVMQAAQIGHQLGAVTAAEVRTEFLGLAPRDDLPELPAPTQETTP